MVTSLQQLSEAQNKTESKNEHYTQLQCNLINITILLIM